MNQLKDQRGVTFVVEIVLVAIVLAAVGVSIYFATRHKAPTAASRVTPTPTVAASADPYAGWKSYTTKNEKLIITYPPSWTIKDTTSADKNIYDSSGRLIYAPGSDFIILTAPSGLSLELSAGAQRFGAGSPVAKVISSTPLNILGQTYYLNYVADNATDYKESVGAQVAKAATDQVGAIPARNIKIGPGATNNPAIQVSDPTIFIYLSYGQTNSEHYPVSKFQQDVEYANVLKVLQRLAY